MLVKGGTEYGQEKEIQSPFFIQEIQEINDISEEYNPFDVYGYNPAERLLQEEWKPLKLESKEGFVTPNEHDTITNPKHYDMQPRPLDAIHGWGLSYLKGCAVKYIARAGRKEGSTEVQDLEKAIQCLRMEIERLERDGEVA